MINIIGAGPVGCFLGYNLSNKYEDIRIFEEHKEIGKPVQCTGIVTDSIKELVKIKKEVVINKIDKARIYSSKNKFAEIKFKERNLVLDRKKFDQSIAEEALAKGVKINTNSRLVKIYDNFFMIKQKNKILKIPISTEDFLIGADGPLSIVARHINPKNKIKLFTGVQARVRIKNDNLVHFFPNFDKIAWLVPENEYLARVGIASDNFPAKNFQRFLDFLEVKDSRIIEKQAGLIPLYNPKIDIQKDNIFIAGDAATFVKATTFGGIVQGLLSSKILSNSIIKNKNYTKEIKNLRKELWIHLKIREILEKFSKPAYDKLIDVFNDAAVKELLQTNSRDNLNSFILKLLIAKPSLIFFTKYLI